MRVLAVFVFTCLLFQTAINLEDTDSKTEEQTHAVLEGVTNSDSESDLAQQPTTKLGKAPSNAALESNQSKSHVESSAQTASKSSKESDHDSLISTQCHYTRLSCSKVFCPPWQRCIEGQCVCKMPYKCPRQDYRACALDGPEYHSMCQAKAISCRSNKPVFSHFSKTCDEEKVKVTLEDSGSDKVVMMNTGSGRYLVCGGGWNMAAANVVCRNPLDVARGAEEATKVKYKSPDEPTDWPTECMRVRCTGSELSLAECTIYEPQPMTNNVASVKCYNNNEPQDKREKFLCVNGKYLGKEKVCDGVDDCGDNSDEMCCQRCNESTAFHCKSDVCIPRYAVRDGIRDCLGGEDELGKPGKKNLTFFTDPMSGKPGKKNLTFFTDPMSEIRRIRSSAESQLQCGVPNMEYVFKQEDDTTSHSRRKRLVGGEEALPTQIQWQVAIQDEGSIHCGGAYLGGCWVLTAAHCVRPKPKSYRIKFSLWKKHRRQSTTDSIPVKNIIIHHEYNPQTYANDIALIQLEELNLSKECMKENPAVRAVCVPWSTLQFQPNDTCTISGWGRDRAGMSQSILKWANVTIIGDCKNYYKDRFFPGMECAGDLEGKVDSCQGDSGGPLVCKDASGVSYVWGIVSWGDKCGEPNNPGVYTKVAHYFDWIRFHTGWAAVTKYNQ